jgi:hypothetical protein
MANLEHLKILEQGVPSWNQWRKDDPGIDPELSRPDLSKVDLRWAHLSLAHLGGRISMGHTNPYASVPEL